jgi:hypothetical protein
MTKYGVALWFAILSVSPAICHEHADGEADHSHGYGLFSLSPLLSSPCSPESELAPPFRHYHLVLFGIEITILPGCAALETGILHSQDHHATLSWNSDTGGDLVAENPVSQQLTWPALPAAVTMVAPAISPDPGLVADPPTPPCLPARALRSGIQLI